MSDFYEDDQEIENEDDEEIFEEEIEDENNENEEHEEEINNEENNENEEHEEEIVIEENDENDENKNENELNMSKSKRLKQVIKIKFTPPAKKKSNVAVVEKNENSQTVLCQFCLDAWDENSVYRWIQCDYCDLWYHLQCSGVSYKRKEYYDVDLSYLDFKCTNCE